MNFTNKLIIAVDFDGTIVEDAYPKIGKPKLFAFETLERLQKEGHRLILWTYRSDLRCVLQRKWTRILRCKQKFSRRTI